MDAAASNGDGSPPTSSDEDPADAFDAALFSAVEYVPTVLRAGQHTLTLAVSAAASTDYDLTGQALWPAAQLLADFLAAGAGAQAASTARAVVELGAGVGFAGLAAAAAAAAAGARPTVVLTDGEPEVVKVLARNVSTFLEGGREAAGSGPPPHPHPPATPADVTPALLRWGDSPAAAALVSAHSPGGFPLIIGADVTYSLAALPALFETAACLATPHPAGGGGRSGRFLLGYVSRSAALDRGVLAAAAGAGWTGVEVPGTRRGMPCGTMEGWVLDFRLGEGGGGEGGGGGDGIAT